MVRGDQIRDEVAVVGDSGDPPAGDEPITVTWANGLVRLTLDVDGFFSEVDIDPRLKRLDSATIAHGLLRALRTAQTEWTERVAPKRAANAVEAFDKQIERLQAAYDRQMRVYESSLHEILRRMDAAGE